MAVNFNKVIKAAMKLPVVTVDREPFLRKELAPYLDRETIDKVILYGPKGLVDKKLIDQIANGCIRYQTTAVCSVSALAGLPGGWAMAGTIPADVAQFYGNAIALVEKLLYLYGWPDMRDDTGEINDQTAHLMILWIGVMMGAQGAQAAVRTLLDALRVQVEKHLLEAALNKAWVYSMVQQVCKWIGVKLSEDGFAKAVGKVIPLAGAPISAGITYFTFKPMCRKLKKELDYQWEAGVGSTSMLSSAGSLRGPRWILNESCFSIAKAGFSLYFCWIKSKENTTDNYAEQVARTDGPAV